MPNKKSKNQKKQKRTKTKETKVQLIPIVQGGKYLVKDWQGQVVEVEIRRISVSGRFLEIYSVNHSAYCWIESITFQPLEFIEAVMDALVELEIEEPEIKVKSFGYKGGTHEKKRK